MQTPKVSQAERNTEIARESWRFTKWWVLPLFAFSLATLSDRALRLAVIVLIIAVFVSVFRTKEYDD